MSARSSCAQPHRLTLCGQCSLPVDLQKDPSRCRLGCAFSREHASENTFRGEMIFLSIRPVRWKRPTCAHPSEAWSRGVAVRIVQSIVTQSGTPPGCVQLGCIEKNHSPIPYVPSVPIRYIAASRPPQALRRAPSFCYRRGGVLIRRAWPERGGLHVAISGVRSRRTESRASHR
jgi:hypothetical protein